VVGLTLCAQECLVSKAYVEAVRAQPASAFGLYHISCEAFVAVARSFGLDRWKVGRWDRWKVGASGPPLLADTRGLWRSLALSTQAH